MPIEMGTENAIKLTSGQIATLVCQLEVSAAKPGNVHRSADFEDATLIDFLNSGVALGHAIDGALAQTQSVGVGQMVLSSVQATAWVTNTNTNLGIILLLCPLAYLYGRAGDLDTQAVTQLLNDLTPNDAQDVYAAIAQSGAGGLDVKTTEGTGKQSYDVRESDSAPLDLLTAMRIAAEHDMIARQYCSGFQDVFEFVLPAIEQGLSRFELLSSAIIFAHVKTMAQFPDSLIARKLGRRAAIQSAGYAQRAIDQFEQCEKEFTPFWDSVSDLDFWLRSDHHRRNPGTTADLISAALYVGVASGRLKPPFR